MQSSSDNCVVCGQRVEHKTPGFTIEFQRELYVFCSLRCLKRFEENPEVYMADIDRETEDDDRANIR